MNMVTIDREPDTRSVQRTRHDKVAAPSQPPAMATATAPVVTGSPLLDRAWMADLRDVLERDLRSFSDDALGASELARLPDDCAEWVESTTATISSRVLGSTFLAIVRELDQALEDAPPEIVHRLELSRAQADVGVE